MADVHVNHLATEVTVKEGQVRVSTPDGLRQSQMIAGQSARAGGDGSTALAVRLRAGQALQPVEPVVVPALQPKLAPTVPASPSAQPVPAESTMTPAAPTPAQFVMGQTTAPRRAPQPSEPGKPRSPEAGSGRNQEPSAARAEGADARPGAAVRVGEPAAPAPRPTDPAAIRRSKFERLTAGLLDGIRPPYAASLAQRPIR